jgi:hypothetical protein
MVTSVTPWNGSRCSAQRMHRCRAPGGSVVPMPPMNLFSKRWPAASPIGPTFATPSRSIGEGPLQRDKLEDQCYGTKKRQLDAE